MFTLLSFKAFACNVLLLFSLLFPVFVSTREERKNECQNKKKNSLLLCVHLSLQPHFLSHTMDLQRPSFLIDFVGNRKKKREKRGGKRSLLFPLPFSSLSCERRSLSRARAQNSSEIDPRSRTMTIPQSSTRTRRLRARAKKHQIFFSEKKKKKNTREERIQTFFSFPRTTRGRERRKTKR